tara:strand:+ start:129 stop:551 length:423 start_codon:yes stop_codon:yes gene_type:complete
MELRDATFSDLEALLPIARHAILNSTLGGLEFNEAIIQRNFVVAMQFNDGFAKVVVHKEKVVGGLVGLVMENHFGIRCAVDLFTYSSNNTDKLINSFTQWSKSKGAQFVQVTDFSKKSRYQKLITLLGFEPGGTNFIKVI